MSGTTKQADQAAIQSWLETLPVRLPDPDGVWTYLVAHGDMTGLLAEVCAEGGKEFLPAAELSLELYRDPEINDEYMCGEFERRGQ
jgi:hypothetical protein